MPAAPGAMSDQRHATRRSGTQRTTRRHQHQPWQDPPRHETSIREFILTGTQRAHRRPTCADIGRLLNCIQHEGSVLLCPSNGPRQAGRDCFLDSGGGGNSAATDRTQRFGAAADGTVHAV